jgi:EAL domain-containing protein (putative c-di-GMP-specific phosphodiesterase class I)
MDIAKNFTDQAIAKTIVTLAHSLGMRTVAEGVETTEQFARLRAFGADCVQGYLFSRPLPAAEFEAFLAGRRSPVSRSA